MASALRFWLEYRGRLIELPAGTTLFGRGEQCQVVLDDGLVSRQHARIVVDQSARIEDAGSSNGVSLNGAKVDTAELSEGDVIGIGQQRLVFHQAEVKGRGRAHTMAETLHGADAMSLMASAQAKSLSPAPSQSQAPARDPLELIGSVVDKALALGRGQEAERLLNPHLLRIADGARATGESNAATERAIAYALRLAEATRKASWVDYCFDVYTMIEEPLPESAVEQLYSTLRNVPGVSRPTYREYLKTLEKVGSGLGPRQRFLVQRISGLESLIR